MRVGVSIGDSMAGIYAAFGIMVSLFHREWHGTDRAGGVDVALTESVLSVMEGLLPEFAAFGSIPEPAGSRIPTAAPTSAYPTADGRWILIAANSDPLFANLARLMGAADLARDTRFLGNARRVMNAAALDAVIGAWTRTLSSADIPNTRAFTAADIAVDPQFRFRKMVRDVEDPNFGRLLHTGIVPHFPDDPGAIAWTGPEIGEHTDEVLRELAGLSPEQIAKLRGEAQRAERASNPAGVCLGVRATRREYTGRHPNLRERGHRVRLPIRRPRRHRRGRCGRERAR